MMPVIQPFPPHVDVSDHAVVRWLERVCGVDIEKYRAEIRAAVAAGGVSHLFDLPDSAGVFVDVPGHRVHLLARDGQVITVFNYDGEPD